MRVNKAVILIPYWIHDVLKRNQLPINDCINLEKINSLFSTNDLICFLALQFSFDRVIGCETDCNLENILTTGVSTTNKELIDYVYTKLSPLSKDKSYSDEIAARLFDSNNKLSQHNEPFTMYDLSPTVCGLVIYPGYFDTKNNLVLQKAAIEAILEVLYVYNTFNEVASTLFFKRYLELLSSIKIA